MLLHHVSILAPQKCSSNEIHQILHELLFIIIKYLKILLKVDSFSVFVTWYYLFKSTTSTTALTTFFYNTQPEGSGYALETLFYTITWCAYNLFYHNVVQANIFATILIRISIKNFILQDCLVCLHFFIILMLCK